MNLLHSIILTAGFLMLFLIIGPDATAQKSCCVKGKKAGITSKLCCSTSDINSKTTGCTPSNCRGAKAKYGEAKVITNLRNNLVALKADLEKSEEPTFDKEAYDIHGIVGESDDESLQIIIDEIKLIENHFTEKMEYEISGFNLPDQKARQVEYLSLRIESLQSLL